MTPMNARDGPSSPETRKAEIRVGQTLEVQEPPILFRSAVPSVPCGEKSWPAPKDSRFNLGDGQGGAFGLSPALSAVMVALVGPG